MKNLSLKLNDETFKQTERIISKLKKSRSEYISEALIVYNRFNKRQLYSKQLRVESKLVASNSLEVLREFEKI